MRDGRRTFLGKAIGGVVALAGLLSPARALAWGRRRGGCCPQPGFLSEGCPPYRGPVSIEFPDEATVWGGGGLYTWGYTTNVEFAGADCGGPGTFTTATPPGPGPSGTRSTWAYRIDGLTPGVRYTLTAYYWDKSGSTPVKRVGAIWPFTPQ
jgi:hypothetical protein